MTDINALAAAVADCAIKYGNVKPFPTATVMSFLRGSFCFGTSGLTRHGNVLQAVCDAIAYQSANPDVLGGWVSETLPRRHELERWFKCIVLTDYYLSAHRVLGSAELAFRFLPFFESCHLCQFPVGTRIPSEHIPYLQGLSDVVLSKQGAYEYLRGSPYENLVPHPYPLVDTLQRLCSLAERFAQTDAESIRKWVIAMLEGVIADDNAEHVAGLTIDELQDRLELLGDRT